MTVVVVADAEIVPIVDVSAAQIVGTLYEIESAKAPVSPAFLVAASMVYVPARSDLAIWSSPRHAMFPPSTMATPDVAVPLLR